MMPKNQGALKIPIPVGNGNKVKILLKYPTFEGGQKKIKIWVSVSVHNTKLIKVRNFWEVHKIWKNLPHGLDVYLSKCTKHEEDCANFCVLLRKSEL